MQSLISKRGKESQANIKNTKEENGFKGGTQKNAHK